MSAPQHPALAEARSQVVPDLAAAFPGAVAALENPHDPTPHVRVSPERIREVALWLRERGFTLHELCGADYLGYPGRTAADRFEVIYIFLHYGRLWRLVLRAPLAEANPEIDTLADLWPMADAAEREVWDQLGVRFRGHPHLTRILNPDDWEGHPLRKDYPLRGPRALVPLLDADVNRFHPFKDPPAGPGPEAPGPAGRAER